MKSVLSSQSSGMTHGSALRCAVAAEAAQLHVRRLRCGVETGRSGSRTSRKASNATPWFPASAGFPSRAFPSRCAWSPAIASCCRPGGLSALQRDLALAPVDARTVFSIRAERRHRLVQWRRRLPPCQRSLRLRRQSCRHPAADVAAHRPYPQRVRQGGAALVPGADDAGAARADSRAGSWSLNTSPI